MIDLSRYRNQTIAVMGLGKSGLAAARALHAAGAQVIAWDDETGRRDAARRQDIPVGDLTQASWQDIALLVLSPGIPHSYPAPHPIAARAREAGRPIVGDVELLARASAEARYIGITGTNGKSTTTSLVGHLLKEAGRPAAVGGNLGLPALDFEPMGKDGFYVIEMSSYQLELTAPIPFDVAVLLNITPDHLDRHGGMPGYIDAKKRIFDGQGNGHAAVVGVDDDICRSIFDTLHAAKRQRVLPISGDRRVSGGVYAIDRFLYDDMDGGNAPILSLDEIRTTRRTPALPMPRRGSWDCAPTRFATRCAAFPGSRTASNLPPRSTVCATSMTAKRQMPRRRRGRSRPIRTSIGLSADCPRKGASMPHGRSLTMSAMPS
jgi:UDP-N-acetylmuramoylalanine--D-glutamate ligase